MPSISALHGRTPVLNVVEPRGLRVRTVSFHRAHADESSSERTDHSTYDAAGRRVSRWDARLWAAANQLPDTPGNVSTVSSLSGQVLITHSADAGWSVELLGERGQRVCRWDGAGHSQRVEYDQLLRPVAVFENDGARESCAERLTYGGPDNVYANQCAQRVRHDDPAGSVVNPAFSLTGQVIEQTRRFLSELAGPDWPKSESDRDSFLELGAGAKTRWRFDAIGDAAEQTDAMGNTQRFSHTISGQLKNTRLQLLNQSLQTLVSDIRYDAHNRIEAETLGNGIVTTLVYDPADGRLRNLLADNGGLQDLRYVFDPVGNVVSVEDRAQPTRYFANQKIEPLHTFAYDTLYQLIEATGYESATANKGPSAHSFATANQLSNYTQRYEYDAGGNLQKLIHTGARNHTRTFATARYSNRTLLQTGVNPPTEEQIAAGFDANGNLRELSPGQTLRWDVRNQLSEVTPVERESGINDREIYQYDAAGARVRKVRVTQAKALTHLSEVRYLPGLEIRSTTATGEVLHVITVTAGRSNIRALHWRTGRPTDIENNQARYSLTDHLGSITLELDQLGQLISQEVYYPYGETAWFAARSEVEAKYKTARYSGRERDATGLYYYGLRYYASWLMRWLNPDPSGPKDGLNLFGMCRNSPVNNKDVSGLSSYDVLNEFEMLNLDFERPLDSQIRRGLDQFPLAEQGKVRDAVVLGISWINALQAALRADRPSIGIMLKNFMGPDYSDEANDPSGLKTSLSQAFKKVENVMIGLASDESWRLLLVDEEVTKSVAHTWITPAQGSMIRLKKNYINNTHPVNLAVTMVHESTHAVPVKEGFGSYDFWYVTSLLPTLASSGEVETEIFESFISSKTMLTGPDEASMDEVSRQRYASIIDNMLRAAGEPPSTGPEERKELFKTDPAVRQTIVLRNADSLAAMALQFHKVREHT